MEPRSGGRAEPGAEAPGAVSAARESPERGSAMNPHDPERTATHPNTVQAPAGFPPAAAADPAALADVARRSMEAEWAAGNRIPAEWYLNVAPALAADPSASLDLVFLEFVLRQEEGED